MKVDFTLLNSVFATKCQELLDSCATQDIIMVPYSGFRTLEEQAKLWRQSRSTAEITQKIAALRTSECDYLADIIEKVGPQPMGRLVTNAIPGLSWHNWGKAMDCYRLRDGKASWISRDYTNYGIIASGKPIHMKWGGDFRDPDYGHVQMMDKEVEHAHGLLYVNDYFREREGQ